MAFKWGTCVGIQEKWEVKRMYDPHFLAKGLKPVRLRPRVLLLQFPVQLIEGEISVFPFLPFLQ